MHGPVKFIFLGIAFVLILLFASLPDSTVRAQTGGGYVCGQFQWMDAGTRGFPAFVPFGYENDPQNWWLIGTLDYMLPVTSTGEQIAPDYGQSLRIWYPEFDSYSTATPYLISVGSYEYVDSCAPIIQLYSETDTLFSGECTWLHWNVDASGLDSAELDGYSVDPYGGDIQVCPSESTTYTLLVNTSGGQFSQSLFINVLQPTTTPIPVLPMPIPSTAVPAVPSYGNALPNDGYEPGLSWLEKMIQVVIPPVEAYSAAECQSRFTVNNCTWFVAGKRTDVCQWIQPGQGNAYQWTDQARQNGASYGISATKKPTAAGNIVVWSPYCAGSLEYGHVALVTGIFDYGKTISIEEMNWSVGGGKRTIAVEDCMDFISNPGAFSSNPTSTPIAPPSPEMVPTPSGKPSNLFQWMIDFFR